MTNSSDGDRLERIEALIESNSRSIEALTDRITEIAEQSADERHELRQATIRVTELLEGIANLTVSLDDDRPTILGRLSRIENKVDRILQRPSGEESS